jgi:hypothetical protein
MMGLGPLELTILAVIGLTVVGVGVLVGAIVLVKIASKPRQ